VIPPPWTLPSKKKIIKNRKTQPTQTTQTASESIPSNLMSSVQPHTLVKGAKQLVVQEALETLLSGDVENGPGFFHVKKRGKKPTRGKFP